jgi:hypothetical protein
MPACAGNVSARGVKGLGLKFSLGFSLGFRFSACSENVSANEALEELAGRHCEESVRLN